MIAISLGSNVGNRLMYLRQAVHLLTQRCLRNARVSIVLETAAIIPPQAPSTWNTPFLNLVLVGETDLSPDALLSLLKTIEAELGRPAPYEKWAPRTIDLDILLWDACAIHTPHLTIPHPELPNRPFLQHLLMLMGIEITPTVPYAGTKNVVLYPALVGVVNITDDSFSDGGQFSQPHQAIEHVFQLAAAGASCIELGAQSTRPGAVLQTPDQEYATLKPVLAGIADWLQQGTCFISIDTFWPSVVQQLLATYPISWINDVKGDLDPATLRLIAKKKSTLCLMHSLSIPPHPQTILPAGQRPIELIKAWGKQAIERLLRLGLPKTAIILDPGIGFGKSMYQNIAILQHIEELQELGVAIMVGHSRKSYITAFSAAPAPSRDLETIAISLALQKKVDFLRVHNVADHMRALVAQHTCTS